MESFLRIAAARPSRMKGRALVLAYHNVVPDEEVGYGDSSLHLSMSRFRRQVDLVQAHCHVVALDTLLSESPRADKPTVAFTFDDAYLGAVELALPELHRRGLPSTLFVAPGLLGARCFWWDELAASSVGLTPATRERALHEFRGDADQIRQGLLRGIRAGSLPESYACATAGVLLALTSLPSVTLGAHSWIHPNLATLEQGELRDQMAQPLSWLRSSGLPRVPMIAYPYGLSSRMVEQAAIDAGYRGGLLVEGGWHRPPADQAMAIPRYNVPAGLSEDGFFLRLSGILDTSPQGHA